MIRKQDILDRAAEWQLRPEVVEKDYVLGWLLAGLGATEARQHWAFKGGTCIKKCYLETYRFSEDLDFSLLPEAPYAEAEIREALVRLTQAARELSGIDFPDNLVEVRPRQNKQGQRTFECRVSYRGPLAFPGYPRVLFDLTRHEPVLDTPNARAISHPYPDTLPEDAGVLAYSFDELLAEKTRALYERSRPRDLYDVVYLLENRPDGFDFAHVQELFRTKCSAKNLKQVSSAYLLEVVQNAEELHSEWKNMLGHQLPSLPDLDSLLQRLPALLAWIDEPLAAPPKLTAAPIPAGMAPVVTAGIQYWGGGLPLETLRFAGANRLMVEFEYDSERRLVETYSLRRAATGNLLFYGWEQGATHIKAFNVAKMRGVRPTNISFTPRYRVELAATGPLTAPPAAAAQPQAAHSARRLQRIPTRSRAAYGPTYVFECPYCQERFQHSRNDPALRKHKSKDGDWECPGRHGHLVEIR